MRLVKVMSISLVLLGCQLVSSWLGASSSVLSIEHYINSSWQILARNSQNLHDSVYDTKLTAQKIILYIPKDENIDTITQAIKPGLADNNLIEIRYLPEDPKLIRDHGLLYLPYAYVVPGGRFNEMYGWDSFL